MNKIILQFVLVVAICKGQEIELGDCPDVPYMKNFYAKLLKGQWYQYAYIPNIYQRPSECVTTHFSVSSNHTISISHKYIGKITGRTKILYGYATFENSKNVGALTYKSETTLGPSGKYRIIDTDYVSYIVIWLCHQPRGSRVNCVFGWILTKDLNPASCTIAKANAAVNKMNLPKNAFVVQKDCPKHIF